MLEFPLLNNLKCEKKSNISFCVRNEFMLVLNTLKYEKDTEGYADQRKFKFDLVYMVQLNHCSYRIEHQLMINYLVVQLYYYHHTICTKSNHNILVFFSGYPGQLDPAVNDRFLSYLTRFIGAVLRPYRIRLVTVVNGRNIEYPIVYAHLQYDEIRP